MTREELAAEIEHTLVEHRADCVLAERTAAAVIRLVVEACCLEIRIAGDNANLEPDASDYGAGLHAAADLLADTFLPPEARE